MAVLSNPISIELRLGSSLALPILGFKFRPEHSEALWAGSCHPTKSFAQELVLFLAFQAETLGFLVEMGKFPGSTHPVGKVFGQGGALASGHPHPMKTGDGVPADVPLRVE